MARYNQHTNPAYDWDNELKRCGSCQLWKPFSDFTKLGGDEPDWKLKSYCRACRAERSRLAKYKKLEAGQYDRLAKEQNYQCAICKAPAKTKSLSLDHCHETDEVRGLLCIPCNRVVGYLDNPEWLEAAIAYLSK